MISELKDLAVRNVRNSTTSPKIKSKFKDQKRAGLNIYRPKQTYM